MLGKLKYARKILGNAFDRRTTKVTPKVTGQREMFTISSKITADKSEAVYRVPRICVTGFKVLNDFHRFIPCSFVVVDPKRPVRTETSRWFFIRYWLIWTATFTMCYLISTLLTEAYEALPPSRHFNLNLFGFFIYSTLLEAYIASSLMRRSRNKWVEIIRDCEQLEERIASYSAMEEHVKLSAVRIRTFYFMLFVMNGGINALNDFGLGIWSNYGIPIPRNLRAMSYFVSAICGTMIPLNSTLGRIWMMFFGRLLVVYVRRIIEILQDVLTSETRLDVKIAVVDNLRLQLTNIRMIVEKLSKIVGVIMLYGYGATIPWLCIAGYFITMPDMSIRLRVFFVAFSSLHILSVLIPIIIVTQLANEISLFKQIIERVPKESTPPLFRTHLALLERAAMTKDFRIDVCGFAKVDLALFMSIIGAGVTYTVMLAQTNNQIFQALAAREQRMNAATLRVDID